MQKPKHYYPADVIRTVAILAVVVIHVFSDFVNTTKYFLTPDWWFANIIDSAARIAVPLFVMLSGLLLLDHSKTYSAVEFFKRRFSKIGFPLLIWPLLYYTWTVIHGKAFTLFGGVHNIHL